MSWMLGLRIVAVVLLGLSAAHSVKVVLWSLAGHERLERRALIGEALQGLGAVALGFGLLPGRAGPLGDALVTAGAMAWVAGALVQPVKRAASRL